MPPLKARGSRGGTIVNPLIREPRQTRPLLALTLRHLDLSEPDEEGAVVNLATGRTRLGDYLVGRSSRCSGVVVPGARFACRFCT